MVPAACSRRARPVHGLFLNLVSHILRDSKGSATLLAMYVLVATSSLVLVDTSALVQTSALVSATQALFETSAQALVLSSAQALVETSAPEKSGR